MKCYYCEATGDLRPYGPNGSMVCFQCAMETPKRKEETWLAFETQLAAAGPVPMVDGTERGPYPAEHHPVVNTAMCTYSIGDRTLNIADIERAKHELLANLDLRSVELRLAALGQAGDRAARAFSGPSDTFGTATGRISSHYTLDTGLATFNGMRVHVSPLCLQAIPVKVHRKRCGSLAYHSRVQKKWNKRYGVKYEPGAYELAGKTLMVHPDIWARMRKAARDNGSFCT